ncbi:Xanthan biosynthesis glycosyltransferase GumI OS=alpha proteobacterium JLT2015 GN=C725_2571 PE=4 SV=1: Glycos_transf_1 [Gemmata massiliana]|uniref:Glycosyltransferase subfamily 4-like N-terminal domain-containing protein n=1 Tax=Gemmata massiliana TaxID=1210884 RepID=A0A6P2DEZ4_9BACT|nr:glycosyltransferase [Gemmata massiliana]VTR99805.1 Xanthan biosynthesis glycosyltransferase GumI OS=alpha proteobacterium JLT2015 GN=C725_2571 PE=4 SV=1: Glycos_transf_1 [Gemmata massiliana]
MPIVSNWPNVRIENRYLDLYYGALAAHGVTLGPGCEVRDDFLRAHAGTIDAIQFQWAPEQIWRCRGTSLWARARGLAGFWKYLRLARSLGIRIVWTLHDVEHHEGSGRLDELGYRLLARFADLCIVHDEWAADQFVRRFGGSRERVRVMEHGNYDGVFPAAASRAETLARFGIDPARRVLLCQGNIRPYKRFDLAIEAAKRLGAEYHLIVAGRPPDPAFADELRRTAAGTANVTLLLGSQSDQVVSDLFAAADCFLLPYAKITGSGSLLTTATLGRGFVASELPYFRAALAQEPDAGVCFPVGLVEGLCNAVRAFFAGDVPARHHAARRIADRVPWGEVVRPVTEWFHRTCPVRAPRTAEVGAP